MSDSKSDVNVEEADAVNVTVEAPKPAEETETTEVSDDDSATSEDK